MAGASQLLDDLKASLRTIFNFVEKRKHFYLAEGLLKSSEVRIEEMSKMLADIFRDPLDDCLCRVNASMLLASKRTADMTRKSIIVTGNLSIQICYVEGNVGVFDTSAVLLYLHFLSCKSSKKGLFRRMC
jgi:hypothetical protein